MEQALSIATFSNGEEDKRLVEGNTVGDEDIYDGICDDDSRFDEVKFLTVNRNIPHKYVIFCMYHIC